MNRATAVWLSLAISMVAVACAGVNPPPSMEGMGGSGGGGGLVTGAGGGGGRPPGGMGGMGVTVGMGGSMCGHKEFDVNRKPVEIFVVFDRSASMKDGLDDKIAVSATNPTKWSQLIPAMMMTLSQADPTISWGMKAFPEDGNHSACNPSTLTAKIDVAIATGNKAAMSAAVGALTDDGDGTPTGGAMRVATKYLQDLTTGGDDRRKYILLATDGEPSCTGSVGSLMSNGSAVSGPDAVMAVTDAANAGFHTFVVGVGTKATDGATLNALAVAGLEPSSDTRPGALRYYQASNQAQLTTTLEAIVNPIASNCVFPLDSKPPVPTNIAVKVNGNKAPQDTTHGDGWDYTDPTLTGLQVYGTWCDQIKSNGNTVEIIYGCPDEIIP